MTRVDAATARRLAPRSAAAQIRELGTEGERSMETQLRRIGATGFVRELRFDEARRWRFDFAWPDLLVALEVEGATWTAGRHTRGAGYEADCEKYDEAAIRGWMVIRVTTDMVDDGRAASLIVRALWSAGQRRNAR